MTSVDNGAQDGKPPAYRRPTNNEDSDSITTTNVNPILQANNETTLITSNLRIFYTIPREQRFCNPIHNHGVLLEHIKNATSTLIIVPNDPSLPSYTDLSNLPKDEATFKKHVSLHTEEFGKSQRITVCHTIKTDVSINQMKTNFENGLMSFLQEHRITIKVDKFERLQVSTIGWLADAHPDLIHRDTLKEEILETMEAQLDGTDPEYEDYLDKGDPDDFNTTTTQLVIIPVFELVLSTINYGKGNERVTTRVIEIQCSREDEKILKIMMSSINLSSLAIKFVPREFLKLTSPEDYTNILTGQNEYLAKTIALSIFGMTRKAAEYIIETTTEVTNMTDEADSSHSIKNLIRSEPYIQTIVPTMETDTTGKWLIITTIDDSTKAKHYIETEFKEIYRNVPNTPDYRVDGYDYPKRATKIYNTSIKIIDHIANLKKNAAPPNGYWRTPARTKRNQTHISYTMTPMAAPTTNNKRMMTSTQNNTSSNMSYSSALTNAAKTVNTAKTNGTNDSYVDQKIKEVIKSCQQSIAEVRNEVKKDITTVNQKIDNFIVDNTAQITDVKMSMTSELDKINETLKQLLVLPNIQNQQAQIPNNQNQQYYQSPMLPQFNQPPPQYQMPATLPYPMQYNNTPSSPYAQAMNHPVMQFQHALSPVNEYYQNYDQQQEYNVQTPTHPSKFTSSLQSAAQEQDQTGAK